MKTTPALLLNATRAAAAPKPTSHLRTLIDLHHSASSFMRDPSEIPVAFESSFRLHTPTFTSYGEYRHSALAANESRAHGGLETLAERTAGGVGAKTREMGESPELSRDIFRTPRSWSYRRAPAAAELTERELRVKEALFGTWERGLDGKPRPGLEGVLEILEARGEDGHVERVREEGETEDGM